MTEILERLTRVEADLCWIKKILWLIILIGLAAVGLEVPKWVI